MRLTARKLPWPAVALCASLLVARQAVAQAASPPPSAATSAAARLAPPPVPEAKSPVDLFRELLAMNVAERKRFLTNRPPETQKQILAKVREYESLRPDQRELRLQVTELRWYVLPLMSTAPTNRAARLASLPPEKRELLTARLEEWDKLTPDVQKELLANEATIRYFSELETDEQNRRSLENLSPARREKLEAGIAQWQALPEEQRRKMVLRFNRFFDLTPREREKALGTLSAAERQQIEKTLRNFEKLPPKQRAQCIRSFEKFASLRLEERQQFLKNAERWKLMSPDERQSWRNLVSRLAMEPPAPTRLIRPPLPPPPRSSVPKGAGLAATNGH